MRNRNHNHKGSPKKLGKPDFGESRYPTAFESEICGLRRNDLIVRDISGQIYIMRCAKKHKASTKQVLPWEESRCIVRALEEYWSR